MILMIVLLVALKGARLPPKKLIIKRAKLLKEMLVKSISNLPSH